MWKRQVTSLEGVPCYSAPDQLNHDMARPTGSYVATDKYDNFLMPPEKYFNKHVKGECVTT